MLIVVSPLLRYIFTYNSPPPLFLYNFTPFRMEPIALGALVAILVRETEISPFVVRLMKIPLGAGIANLCRNVRSLGHDQPRRRFDKPFRLYLH